MPKAIDEVDGNIRGDIYWQIQARRILPVLVRQARAGEPISYEDLGKEVNVWHRKLGKPLGCIGFALTDLCEEWEYEEIPHIQSLVIKKDTELPGEGFDGFLEDHGYGKLSKAEKKKLLKVYYADIYGFLEWEDVLAEFDLEPLVADPQLIKKTGRGGGEGPEHERLKHWIRDNPHIVKLPKNNPIGRCEKELFSGDRIDVYFERRNHILAVEVKPAHASNYDIHRGLFQCVKYKAVLEAQQQCYSKKPKLVEAILVLGGSFPDIMIPLKNTLGVKVIENMIPE